MNELRGISPTLASLPFIQPYQDVPEGYFEGLLDEILLQVREDQKSVILGEADKSVPYEAPQGYFHNLPAIIMQRIKANDQENSDEELETLSPLLGGLKNKNTFEVPRGYFDDLSGNAIAGAKAIEFVNVELENLSPLMSALKEKQVYETPAGYFESLPSAVLEKAKESAPPAKIVSINTTRRVMRFAVAAAVIGFVAVFAWFYANQPSTSIPAKGMDVADFRHISDTELQSFAESESGIFAEPFAATATSDVFTEADVKDLLADISDEELQKYIDEESGVKKTPTN